jgi:hypothetical protein
MNLYDAHRRGSCSPAIAFGDLSFYDFGWESSSDCLASTYGAFSAVGQPPPPAIGRLFVISFQ